MPKRISLDPAFPALLDRQHGMVSRSQAFALGHTRGSVDRLLRDGGWSRELPEVYRTGPGARAHQLIHAALLYGGPTAALDSHTALHSRGLRYLPADDRVHIVVPHERRIVSRGLVVVRRARQPIAVEASRDPRCVVVAQAVVAWSLKQRRLRDVRAVASEVVQRGLTTVSELSVALAAAPRRGSHLLRVTLDDLAAGCRSAPEAEFRDLAATSTVLPEPRWNQWLALADGTVLGCADAYWEIAALVHEIDGRDVHAWAEGSDETQRRHGRLSAAGLTVIHTAPYRLRTERWDVLGTLEAAFLTGCARGPAPDVIMIDPPPWARHR